MKQYGKIVWLDLTVENAEQVKDFYCQVVGWTFSKQDQGDYNDFNMINFASNEVIAGICHKRGSIKNLPSQWLNYVLVENMDACIEKCVALGGQVIDGPNQMGNSNFAVIQDPAGAYLALFQE